MKHGAQFEFLSSALRSLDASESGSESKTFILDGFLWEPDQGARLAGYRHILDVRLGPKVGPWAEEGEESTDPSAM